MRRFFISVLVMTAGFVIYGCRSTPVDTDLDQAGASRLVPGILIKDSLDARPEGADRVDWRRFSHYEAGQAHVVFSVGDRFGQRDFVGAISLHAADGTLLESRRVIPDVVDYVFTFPVAREVEYFFKIEGDQGRTDYKVQTRVDPPDPCAACGPDQECCKPTNLCCPAGSICKDGACLPPDTCAPPCRASHGQVCEAGRCIDACQGGCRSGMTCDVGRRRCVSARSAPPPPRRQEPAPRPTGCSPACKAGEHCNASAGVCEAVAFIEGTVLSVKDEGGGTRALVNRGSKDGVRMGATGSIGSVAVRVVYVSSTRCRVQAPVPPSQIKANARVRINR